MANTVIFETQREDGTWKTWKNVAIPVKYGNLLDEQLDYAVVSLARVKRKQFKPMTRARLTVTSETEHGTEHGEEQSQTIDCFVANDDAFETPIGSKAYNHELTLIEITKFLECFQLESLCFTNPNGNDYTRVATAPSITDEPYHGANELSYKWIDETSSDIKTPAAVGTSYKLYNLKGFGIGGLGEDENAIVTIKNKYGDTTYNSNDYEYGLSFNNVTFEITEGNNEIEYKYGFQLGTIFEDIYGYERFTIYGVENKYPLKPWTVNDVIQRVLQLVEPIRVNGTPRFSFTPPTDSKAKLFSQIAPEFTFTRMTLREALQAVGGFIHAEPRLTANNEIVFDYYGEQERAKIHNYRTGEDKYINETKYRALQSVFGIEQACTKLDSYQQNLVNRLAWEQGTTVSPYKGGEQTLRTETAYVRGEENFSFNFPTQQGVDRVVKLEYIGEDKDGKPKTFDITQYVFEEKVYNNLSSYEGGYPFAKAYALYYTQSGKGINGFFFKAPAAVANGAFKNYAIVNILDAVGAKIPKGENKEGKTVNAYDKMKFRLEYVPIYSTRVQQSKPYLDEYLPLPRVLNYNQTDNSVETRFFGENIKGAVSRMGNPEKTYTLNLRNLNNIPKAGQLWDNDYYIVSVSVAVNQDLFEVSVGLSKHFNRKSQYVGAGSIKRIYEVSEEMVQQRHTIYTDYIVLTKSVSSSLSIPQNGILLEENAIKAIPSMLNGDKYSDYSEISCVSARGYTYKGAPQEQVLLPVVSSAFGNVMEFTWEYKDNFSAGLQNVELTEGEITGSFGKETEYTDYYGRLWSYSFALMSDAQLKSLNSFEDAVKAEKLPQTTALYVPEGKSYVNTGTTQGAMLERKDGRETLKKTYALEFVTDESSFVIGSAFASKSPLVHSADMWYVPRLYILQERINKFASNIDIEGLTPYTDTNDVKLEYSETPVPHFTVYGVKAKETGKAWAYVIPQSIKEVIVEDETGEVSPVSIPSGGELIIGENIDINVGDTIGAFKGLAIHDVFKYLEAKRAIQPSDTVKLTAPTLSIDEDGVLTITPTADATERFAIFVNGVETATVSNEQEPETPEEPDTPTDDTIAISSTWYFNEKPQPLKYYQEVRFTSNGRTFYAMYGHNDGYADLYYYESVGAGEYGEGVFKSKLNGYDDTWVDEDYRTITFDGVQYVSKEFYDWLAANAAFAFTIDGTTYYAKEGMTWSEWVESEYNTLGLFIWGGIVINDLSSKGKSVATSHNSNSRVKASDVIMTGYDYVLYQAPGSN